MAVPAASVTPRSRVRAMLEARSVAVVGASPRPGSFGERLVTEVTRSPGRPAVHLVNPRYQRVAGRPCLPSLADVPGPVDLVLLGVRDDRLEEQLELAAERGDRSAVVFGTAYEAPDPHRPPLSDRLATIARKADMALCGAGCMGFVNLTAGLRAIGFLEREDLPSGSVALVSHSGSAFSALLRSNRQIGFTLAVSSGQELVTTAADYLEHSLALPATRIVALLLETLREPARMRAMLDRAADRDVPVVLLTVGGSPTGRAMVSAHSGALAGDDAAWEAITDAHGLLRVGDLDEMADLLELLAAGRRPGPPVPGGGLATVHDSGAERSLVADVAHRLEVPFADLSGSTRDRLAGLLDPGIAPENPLDVWGRGAGTRPLFAGCLQALLDDPAVAVVALCVDLVPEYDGDDSYPLAVLDAHAATTKPVVVLSNMASSLDQVWAQRLRGRGVPVLEGTRSGLTALGRLMQLAAPRPRPPDPRLDVVRRAHWSDRIAAGPLTTVDGLALLADYGVETVRAEAAADRDGAVAAAEKVGWPAVLKTDEPAIAHRSDVGGVVTGLTGPDAVAAAYDDLAGRLGPRVVLCATAGAGVELALGVVRDPLLGPIVVVGAGGILVELLADRAVGLPPLDERSAGRLLHRLACRGLLEGVRGRPPSDVAAVQTAVAGLGRLALEVGDQLEALDVNPLVAGPDGAVAVDVLVVPRGAATTPTA